MTFVEVAYLLAVPLAGVVAAVGLRLYLHRQSKEYDRRHAR